jgi:hypothetical protein
LDYVFYTTGYQGSVEKFLLKRRIAMSSKTYLINVLFPSLLLISTVGADPLYAAVRTPNGGQPTTAAGGKQQAATDVKGTWSGTFFSKHSNVAPFTMTVVISADSHGHLTGNSSFNSECLKGAQVEVTVTGSQVVLAGRSKEGDNITVRGTVDNTGTLLKVSYILNGSASGQCETDGGTGTLAKR